MLALGALYDPEILPGALLDPADATDVATVFRGHPRTLELPRIEAARPRGQRLGGRHRDQPADEGPRRLRRFHALEGQQHGVTLAARGGHAPGLPLVTRRVPHHARGHAFEALGPIGEGRHPDLTTHAMRPHDLADGNELFATQRSRVRRASSAWSRWR